eukprot:6665258-Alexandrium_andersonii.AAC.1
MSVDVPCCKMHERTCFFFACLMRPQPLQILRCSDVFEVVVMSPATSSQHKREGEQHMSMRGHYLLPSCMCRAFPPPPRKFARTPTRPAPSSVSTRASFRVAPR